MSRSPAGLQITGLLVVLAAGVGVASLFIVWAFRKPSTRQWQRAHYRAMRPRWVRWGRRGAPLSGKGSADDDKSELDGAAADSGSGKV